MNAAQPMIYIFHVINIVMILSLFIRMWNENKDYYERQKTTNKQKIKYIIGASICIVITIIIFLIVKKTKGNLSTEQEMIMIGVSCFGWLVNTFLLLDAKDKLLEMLTFPRIRIIAATICMILSTIICVGVAGVESSSGTVKPDDMKVWTSAESYIRSQLKNPKSANFCPYYEATISYTESTGIYTVKGYVDATNSFGATIRQNFTCNLEVTSDGYKNASAIFY